MAGYLEKQADMKNQNCNGSYIHFCIKFFIYFIYDLLFFCCFVQETGEKTAFILFQTIEAFSASYL